MSVEKNTTPTTATRPSQAVADNISPQGISHVAVPIQLHAVVPAATSVSDAAVARVNDTGMPDQLKNGVEYLSGMDLSDVKVHYNSDKPAQLQALAYAQGNDIHLGPGEERHLPHEAWHVVQQRQGRVQATRQLQAGVPVNDDQGLEREADVMGSKAMSVSAPVSFVPSAVGKGAAGLVVQRVNAYIEGGGNRRRRFKTLKKNDLYELSGTKQRYLYVSGSEATGDLTLKPLKAVNKTPINKGIKKPTTQRDKKAVRRRQQPVIPRNAANANAGGVGGQVAAVVPVVVQQPQRQRQSQVAPQQPVAITFDTLNRVQQEQVLALAKHVVATERPRLEEYLAKVLYGELEPLCQQAEYHYNQLQVPRAPLFSTRDQSKHFGQQVININSMFGGSIDKNPGKDIRGQQETELAVTNDGLQVDSHYAEANRTAENHVSTGTDNRLAAVVTVMSDSDKDKCRWALFAYMRLAHQMTLYEVLHSVSSVVPLDKEGTAIYSLIPEQFMKAIGWGIKLSDLLSKDFLTIIAKGLHESLDALHVLAGVVPDWIIGSIVEGIKLLHSGTRRAKEKDTWFAYEPDVLVAETSDEHLAAIKQMERIKEDQRVDYYRQLKQSFQGDENVPAYLLLKMVWGGIYDAGSSGWAGGVNNVLTPPERREDGSNLEGPAVSSQSGVTLKESIVSVSDGLGEYDFGTSIEDKKDEVDALVENDIAGAYGINKYISGGYTKISNTLDAPWAVEGDGQLFKSVQGATRGLEALPVYEGWVYRQEAGVQDFVPGEIISPGTLWSAARAPRFGAQFDRQASGTLYIINSMYTGKDVQLLAGKLKWYQREVLFPPYVRFVVEGKQPHGNKGIAYILKELPPSGPPLTEALLQQAIGTTQLEAQEVKTFIDKAHYDVAVHKYNTQTQWTSDEAHQQGIETLRSGIHHPKALYGLQKFRQWQALLREQEDGQALDVLWTVPGFKALAKKLTGKDAFRDEYSGWGDKNGYLLTDPQIAALQQKGLNVTPRIPAAALVNGWQKNLDRQWVADIQREVAVNNGYFTCNLADIPLLQPVLIPGQVLRFDVYYPHANSLEVTHALTNTLQQCKVLLVNQHQQLVMAGGIIGPQADQIRDYNRLVAATAAHLQQDLVAIHPFEDGNGRISRMYMYKVLQHYTINTQAINRLPVIDNTGADLTSTKQDWGQMLADKVQV